MLSKFLPQPPDPAAPARSEALLQQGHSLLSAFDLDAAEPLLQQALAISPDSPGALLGMAMFHHRRGTNPAAQMDLAFRALSGQPGNAAAHKLFALGCRAHGLEPLAIGHLRRCIELDPRDTNAFFHLGLTLLEFGHWDDGWRTYEQRPTMDTSNGYTKPAPPGSTPWRGEDLSDKSILLLGEDGHGDQIQNFRFVQRILALKPKRLILDVRPPLRRLFLHALRALPDAERVSVGSYGDVVGNVDAVLAFGSMGAHFNCNGDSLAQTMPYLRAAGESRIRSADPVRIGIAWRGLPLLDTDQVRSIALNEFAVMIGLPGGVQWVSLQHGDYQPHERAILERHAVETPIRSSFDFLDTAGIVADLDLVISVDTSIIHLAGGMGKPVWLLNRATSEWRWGWKKATSPWYPTLRIFNQDKLLDWGPMLLEVSRTLSALLQDESSTAIPRN